MLLQAGRPARWANWHRPARRAARRTSWGSAPPARSGLTGSAVPSGPSYFEMRVRPVPGVRLIPPSLSLNGTASDRRSEAGPARRGPWLLRVRQVMPWRNFLEPSRKGGVPELPGLHDGASRWHPQTGRGGGGTGCQLCHSRRHTRVVRGCPILDWARPLGVRAGPVVKLRRLGRAPDETSAPVVWPCLGRSLRV